MTGQRAWVDHLIRFSVNGTLVTYEFYAGHFEGTPPLRLQIWTIYPDKISSQFTLKWQQIVTLDKGPDTYYMVKNLK